MKKSFLALVLGAAVLLSACGNDKAIDGKVYPVYGIANEEVNKDSGVLYEISAGSVIWGIILCETIVVPVYVLGWDLWQPVRKR